MRALTYWGSGRYSVLLERQVRGEAGKDDKGQTLEVFSALLLLGLLKL